MINRIKIHIPVQTPEQIVIRDEVAKHLSEQFPTILSYVEFLKKVDGKIKLFPISIVTVYIDEMTDYDLDYFKKLVDVIASKVADSVILEVVRESIFMGTAQPTED